MDEHAIRQVTEAFLAAWNTHDMGAFAALYSDDADFVNVYGMHWKGRDVIGESHRALHETIFKASRLSATRTEMRFLRDDVVVLHMFWDLTGLQRPDGTPVPDRRGILLHVLERSAEGWRIVATQNTDIVPPPA
jgi:uncharacterized protein (TIGR02246 family)